MNNHNQNTTGKQPRGRGPAPALTIKDMLTMAPPELREFSTVVQAAYRLMPSFLSQKVGGTAMKNPIFEELLHEQMHALLSQAQDLLKSIVTSSAS